MKKILGNKLVKTLLIFILYLSYSKIFELLLGQGILCSLLGDILFLIGILFYYKNNLKEDYKEWQKIPFKKRILSILGYIGCIFLLGIITGIIIELFIPDAANSTTDNAEAIANLFNVSFVYTLFKTLIFASVAEELVFKEAIHDIIDNNWLFILVSSLIYATLNIIYGNLDNSFLWLDFIQFFSFSLVLSTAYVRCNNNIFMVIFIKLIYNLFPTILLILTTLVK